MSTVSTPPAAAIPSSIAQQLRRLRRSVFTWLAVDGFSRLLLAIIAIVFVDLIIDWTFRLDQVQRIWMLCIAAGLMAWIAYRRLLLPLSSRLDDDALCLQVEARHPQLGQSLISAVQFARRGLDVRHAESLGLSPAMIAATIDDGARRSTQIDFRDVLDDLGFRRNMLLAFLAVVMLAVIAGAIVATRPMQIWFDRNVLLGESQWPQKTYLVVKGVGEDGTLALPRGDDWVQVIEATGVVPSLVYLDFQPVGGRRTTEQMQQVGELAFHTTFKNMLDEFRFRAYGGDATTPWITVRLVDRPAVAELKLMLQPPAYTAIANEELPPGAGPYSVLKGSQLVLSGTTNKELARAEMKWGDKTQPLSIDGNQFSATLGADDLSAATYSLDFKDREGLQSKRPTRFTLSIKTDREPNVRSRLDGISGMIVPGARIPVASTMQDDFAVTASHLQYEWRIDGTDSSTQGGAASGRYEFADISSQYGQPKIAYEYPFDTAPLELPVGANLSFYVEALDNDNISSPAGQVGKPGRSEAFLLRVVSEEELRADLLRREKERRLDVERLLKDQEELQTETRALLATLQNSPTSPEQRSAMVKIQKRQQLAADRTESVAKLLAQLMVEVENNRLEEEDGPIQQRLHKQIIDPLLNLAQKTIPAAASHLDEARRESSNVASRNDSLAKSVAQQDQIVRDFREILRHMAKSEGYQEAINLLYAILKSQGDVNRETLKEAQERLRDIFK